MHILLLKLWIRNLFLARCTSGYNIIWWSLSVTWDRSVAFSGFLHQWNWGVHRDRGAKSTKTDVIKLEMTSLKYVHCFNITYRLFYYYPDLNMACQIMLFEIQAIKATIFFLDSINIARSYSSLHNFFNHRSGDPKEPIGNTYLAIHTCINEV